MCLVQLVIAILMAVHGALFAAVHLRSTTAQHSRGALQPRPLCSALCHVILVHFAVVIGMQTVHGQGLRDGRRGCRRARNLARSTSLLLALTAYGDWLW